VRLAGRSARFDSRFLDLALHPGGGHTWMLDRILGPQGAMAITLLGEALDGEAAARHGLAWRCVDDDQLLDEARRLASRVASAPAELVRRIKANLQRARAVPSHAEAVQNALEDQLWSLGQAELKTRLAALRSRISSRSG
jgi:enoyl-CoA hydratase